MIIQKFKELKSYLFAENENFPLEHRIVLSSLIVGILVSMLGGFINFLLVPSSLAVAIPFILSLMQLVIYYFVRVKKIVKPFLTPTIILAIFGISTIWVFNGGINGSNIMPAFIILILGSLVVPTKVKKYIIILFITVNICILLIQLYRPDLITQFPTEKDRWVDNIITVTYSSYFIYIIIRFVHKNYTNERLKAEKSEQRLQQLNADKDRFISILSHDLKSPFNNLLGLSEILTEDLRKLSIDEIERHVIAIYKTTQKTYQLLEDILLWARAQQGKLLFNPQTLNLADICNNTLEALLSVAKTKNISINYSEVDQIKCFADTEMLKTVLRNLVSNAIKFTNTGGAIEISAVQTGSEVTIIVSDNGVGISGTNITKLFDISEVVTTQGTAHETGTGLGLLLCKEFVEKHGGKIWVESEEALGSQFKFTLPRNILPVK